MPGFFHRDSCFRRIICEYILKPIDKHDICIVMLLTLLTSELGELIDPKKDIQKPFSLVVLFTIITSTFYHFFSELSTIDKVLNRQQQSIYDVQKNVCSLISRGLCIATYIIILKWSSISTFYFVVCIFLICTNSGLSTYSMSKLRKCKKFTKDEKQTNKQQIWDHITRLEHIRNYAQRSLKYFIKMVVPVCMVLEVMIDFQIDRDGQSPPYSWMNFNVPVLYFAALSADSLLGFLQPLSHIPLCKKIQFPCCGQDCLSIINRLAALLEFSTIVAYFAVLGITVDATKDFSKPDSKPAFYTSLVGLILSSLAVVLALRFIKHKTDIDPVSLGFVTMYQLAAGHLPRARSEQFWD